MGFEQILRGGPCTLDIALATRWVHAEHIAAETEALRLIDVAGVARRLDARRPLFVLPPPPVAVGIAALDLVGGHGGAEQEAGGKSGDGGQGTRRVAAQLPT